ERPRTPSTNVMARGNRREPIVWDDGDRALFLETFAEVCGSRLGGFRVGADGQPLPRGLSYAGAKSRRRDAMVPERLHPASQRQAPTLWGHLFGEGVTSPFPWKTRRAVLAAVLFGV